MIVSAVQLITRPVRPTMRPHDQKPQKLNHRFLESNGHYLTYNVLFFLLEEVKNQVRKLMGGRKVGVTHEKMAI